MPLKFSFQEKKLDDRKPDEVPREFAILCEYPKKGEIKVGFLIISDDGESIKVQFLITETEFSIRTDVVDACELPIANFVADLAQRYFAGRVISLEDKMPNLAKV